METVFLAQHLHTLPDGEEDIKIIGVYKCKEDALSAIEKLKKESGFCDFPKLINQSSDDETDGFYIAEYTIGKTHWTEGYITK